MSKKAKRDHLIVPIFIPHEGCPYRCIYCHQEKITNQSSHQVTSSMIREIMERAVRSDRFRPDQNNEIAFYGGTFTRLPESRLLELLKAVQPYIETGLFSSIRVSTRPDTIDEKKLVLLRDYHVTTVELGAQSLNNRVLSLSRRGHRKEDIITSVHKLNTQGFKIGIQLMPGLPGDSRPIFLEGIEEVITLKPNMVRLYPTVVIKDTKLADLYKQNLYQPLEITEAVKTCAEACLRLEKSGIPVIRIGLMTSKSLAEQILAGPWHEAFGFLVRSAIYREMIASQLPEKGKFSSIIIKTHPSDIPLIRGHRNYGLTQLEKTIGTRIAKVSRDNSLPSGKISVEGRK